MKNNNIGIVKVLLSNKLKKDFLGNNSINESKKLTSNFLDVVKNDNILQLQFEVYKNLENKSIKNDVVATRYIDENVSLFNKFKLEDIIASNKKLKKFIDEDVLLIDDNKITLYESINNLIVQATSNYDSTNIDAIHESFVCVLNHIKNNDPKQLVTESVEETVVDTDTITLAIQKFNERYSSLNEGERKIISVLVTGSEKDKTKMFESLRDENLDILSKIDKNGIEDKINETVDRIKDMKYNSDSSINDVINLYELKNNLS